ncbi:DEKNAAC100280 [Brettanomyces naardenensis]|uniref:Endonuclease III homolog n=1 Tax=Brettanomyces naardenensis TaxID=13370 RepID=A0A448YFZ9_BRENA|nr:DEKNAAC100280 [Brettanomyces naardenensis]
MSGPSKSKYFPNSIGRRTRSTVKREVELGIPTEKYETFQNDLEKMDKKTVTKGKRKRIEVKIDPDDLAIEAKPKKAKARSVKPKKTKKSTTKGADNDEKIPSEPPANFWPMYNEIKKMRAKIIAPVDKKGCASISTAISGLKEGVVWRFQVLITLMLSSQTKDEVNYEVMKGMHEYFLGEGYKDGLCLRAILDVDQSKLDELIYKVGFHHRKAEYIKKTAEIVKEKYNGDIPKSIEEITGFPGVGPKMGFLLLQIAWGIYTGIGVDTHMARMAGWFHWVPQTGSAKPSPEYVRKCLEKMLADHKEEWRVINPTLVGFGQMVCLPQSPRCDICTLAKTGLCPAVDKRLLRRVEVNKQRGVSSPQKKSRGDLSKLMQELE